MQEWQASGNWSLESSTDYNSQLDALREAVLVLDLDETLVHCTVEPISDADMVFPVVFNGVEYSVNVRKRPYLEEFLQKVAGKFEVSATR